MEKVNVYIRVGNKDNVELNYNIQMKEIQGYCDKNGYKIDKVYEDIGVSGKKKLRTGILELLKDVESKKVKKLIIVDLTRIYRNIYYLNEFVDKLYDKNCLIETVIGNFDNEYRHKLAFSCLTKKGIFESKLNEVL